MKRRSFLKYSGIVIGSGAFALAGLDLIKSNNSEALFDSSQLSPQVQNALLALSQIILPKGTSFEAAIKTIERMDQFILSLPQNQKEELSKIFNLLESNVIIKVFTSTPLDFKNSSQVQKTLKNWKNSFDHFLLGNDLRRAYKALTELFFVSFYSLPEGQKIAGYGK